MISMLFLLVSAQAEDTASLETKATAALVETIEMTSTGQLDAWMDKYCEPERCKASTQRSEWKAYQLKQAQAKAGACMTPEKKVTVSQRRGEVASGDEVIWFIKCEGRQMPVSVRFRYDKEADRFYYAHLGF